MSGQSDTEYLPSTDGEFETPEVKITQKRRKRSSIVLKKKNSQSSLLVSVQPVILSLYNQWLEIQD